MKAFGIIYLITSLFSVTLLCADPDIYSKFLCGESESSDEGLAGNEDENDNEEREQRKNNAIKLFQYYKTHFGVQFAKTYLPVKEEGIHSAIESNLVDTEYALREGEALLFLVFLHQQKKSGLEFLMSKGFNIKQILPNGKTASQTIDYFGLAKSKTFFIDEWGCKDDLLETNSQNDTREKNPKTNLVDQEFEQVKIHIEHLLNSGLKAEEIVLVTDVDGTLTTSSTPNENGSAKSRDNSVEILKWFADMGGHIIVASAWDDFNATLSRLEAIGLKQVLQIKDNCTQNLEGKISSRPVKGFCCGLVCSLKNIDGSYMTSRKHIDRTYFRQKAGTIEFMLSSEVKQSMKHLIFVDDSGDNVTLFNFDIDAVNISKKISITTFTLTPPKEK